MELNVNSKDFIELTQVFKTNNTRKTTPIVFSLF